MSITGMELWTTVLQLPLRPSMESTVYTIITRSMYKRNLPHSYGIKWNSIVLLQKVAIIFHSKIISYLFDWRTMEDHLIPLKRVDSE